MAEAWRYRYRRSEEGLMLVRILLIAKIALCLVFTTLCVMLAIFAVELRRQAVDVRMQFASVVAKVNLNLDESHHLILEAGLAAMEARKASAEERSYLAKWNDGISEALGNANGVLVSLKATSDGLASSQQQIAAETVETLHTANQTIAGLQPVETNTSAAIVRLDKATQDLDSLIADQNLKSTLAHIEVTTNAVSGMATDTQKYWHNVLYPKWPKRVLGYVTGVGLDVGKLFIP
jgi:hypothetical protein